MTTRYKKASKAERLLFRIIAGAVINAAHGHPEIVVTKKFARGVAKRAIGTLLAESRRVGESAVGAASDSSDR